MRNWKLKGQRILLDQSDNPAARSYQLAAAVDPSLKYRSSFGLFLYVASLLSLLEV